MADTPQKPAQAPFPGSVVLLSEDEVARVVAELAERIAPVIDDETVAVVLLTGGLWFAADLTRALARLNRHVHFDALWVSSYKDGKKTTGEVQLIADCQRDVAGRRVLIMDDVFDSGLSLQQAAKHLMELGASEVLTCVFASKSCAAPEMKRPDFVGWEAPSRFLVGYGLDHAGKLRGLPSVCALD